MLIDIYRNLQSRIGFKDSERAVVVSRINDAAQEIWSSTDLKESLDECIVDINVDAQTVTLPWFVENVKKMRYYNGRMNIDHHDMRNRYNDDFGNEVYIHRFRQKRRTAIGRTLENFTRLTFTLPIAEAIDIKLSIQGETTNSSKSSETLTLVAGQTTVESSLAYMTVDNIAKSVANAYDITVTDADDNVLSVIPNHLLYVKYSVLQIQDQESTQLQSTYSSIEVLYKLPFSPMVHDFDEFCYGNKYDMCVVWKYLEQNKNMVSDAAAAQAKCTQILDQILASEMSAVTTKVNYDRQALFNLPYGYPRS
jgi:hypothetical protein